jgi:uncharacterized protein YjdB
MLRLRHAKRIVICLLLLLAFVWGNVPPAISAQAGDDYLQLEKEAAQKKERTLLVQYKETSSGRSRAAARSFKNCSIQRNLASNIDLLQVNEGTDVKTAIHNIRQNEDVLYVEENKILTIDHVPNDTYYGRQWALDDINAGDAWDAISKTEKSVVVAVIDTGLDKQHPDLVNRIDTRGYNFIANSSNIYDNNGHGTFVAGIIAAQTDNKAGIAGVAGTLEVRVLPLKTASSDGSSYLSDVIDAIDYAIDCDVDVINLSMGSEEFSDIENAAIQRAAQAGIVIVAAAGNESNATCQYPASYNNVISVGSIGKNHTRSYFSNYNNKVDLVAPGENIYSCYLSKTYKYMNGTSFSAPMVAGVAAVLKAVDASLDPAEIESIITGTAVDEGSSGKDNYYGYGRLDFAAAVNKLVSATDTVPVTGISLNQTQLSLNVGTTAQLQATLSPVNASNQTVAWSSSNTSIAKVSSSGLVTGVSAGQAVITATSQDGGKTARCTVTVSSIVPVTAVSLNQTQISMKVGAAYQLKATLSPVNASNQTVAWSSSNASIAKVSSSGLVTGVSTGQAVITATSQDGGKTAACTVTVSNTIPVTAVSLNLTQVKMRVGYTVQLKATITPSNASNQTVSWTSSRTAVAKVDSNGLVTAMGPGQAVITAATRDGGKTATCTIKVASPYIFSFTGTEWEEKVNVAANRKWVLRLTRPSMKRM